MEKKTIGKFISALRKASGMTQRELGEKLFVSDKTVSRWECDECTPELSLIPTIAEIFGITTDELLRGERNNPDRETVQSEESIAKQKAKSDKQFRLLLDTKKRKYQNLSLISVGIAIFGLLAAVIANLGFSKGLIAFCLATAFCMASEIAQICFAVSARILPDEDDDTYTERIETFNMQTVVTAVKVSFFNLFTFAFCLPLVTMINGANWGLAFDDWSFYGLMFSVVTFAACYILYTFVIRKILFERGLLTLSENQKSKIKRDNRLLIKILAIAVAVALFLCICIVVWNIIGHDISVKKYTFENCTDFKIFMESDYDTWVKDGYSYVDQSGNPVVQIPIDSQKTYGKIKNSKGEVICEYYYNPDLYHSISYTEASEDRMPVTVIRTDDYLRGRGIYQTVELILYVLIVMDFIVAAGVYWIKTTKRKNSI